MWRAPALGPAARHFDAGRSRLARQCDTPHPPGGYLPGVGQILNYARFDTRQPRLLHALAKLDLIWVPIACYGSAMEQNSEGGSNRKRNWAFPVLFTIGILAYLLRTPGGIRTPNLLIRSYLFEPELGLFSLFYQGFGCQEWSPNVRNETFSTDIFGSYHSSSRRSRNRGAKNALTEAHIRLRADDDPWPLQSCREPVRGFCFE